MDLNAWVKVNFARVDKFSNSQCDLIPLQIHFILISLNTKVPLIPREYARGRRERHNRIRPADVAFFSSESDKNVALIFRKIGCFNIHFNIHTCHQLVFDLGRSSTRYPSGFHKKSIHARGSSGKAADVFP